MISSSLWSLKKPRLLKGLTKWFVGSFSFYFFLGLKASSVKIDTVVVVDRSAKAGLQITIQFKANVIDLSILYYNI
jgi:hypothetical protein